MNITVEIKGVDKKYDVVIGHDILSSVTEHIQGKKVVIITDETIKSLYAKKLTTLLPDALLLSVPPDEHSKSRAMKEKLEDEMLAAKCNRNTVVIALGGGMVGDLAGYVAATFMRGVSFIQVPTSLLAMVDASIGGKTGINTKQGKNLIGATWQPQVVLADLTFLDKLPKDEFLSGLAEVIKIAATSDESFFTFIEENVEKILNKDKETLLHLVQRAAELKIQVVQQDEREEELRKILNFGHTVGHAIEKNAHYKIKHGFCVSLGLVVEAEIAMQLGVLKKEHKTRLVSLLEKVGLPTKTGKQDIDALIAIMKVDKKVNEGNITCVLLEKIGKSKTENNKHVFAVDEEIIGKALQND